ncbi:choline/ethanolamine kinase protein (plasmid) [Rhizobium sp. Kim5]|uniref:phosphotransferase n=1 Tax=Rhizobium sp. Kim5 TaxID=2020311 RepID=UPI000A29F4A8|nr:phosphotransferase [Rhizobium sp. Kim5]ARQ62145.1 choline/ethanolamine kinase protein [Rhizobium sp. Kim5]
MIPAASSTNSGSGDLQARCVFEDDVPDLVRNTAVNLLDQWRFLPGERDIRFSILPGGANNINLVLRHADGKWALKIREPDASFAGTSVTAAVEAQAMAASFGLAPAVIAKCLPEGHFMSEFVEGETLRPQHIRHSSMAPRIVDTLKQLHAHHFSPRKFDIFDDLRGFMAGAAKLGGSYPTSYAALWKIAQRFESILAGANAPVGFGHNDLVPQNFIACSDSVKMVDFDYAGEALLAIDLASVTSQAEMSDDETTTFLRLYDPDLDKNQIARVQVLRFVNALREVAWAAMAEPFMAAKTTLLDGWSYRSHADVNIRLAEALIRQNPADDLASKAGFVRPGALF